MAELGGEPASKCVELVYGQPVRRGCGQIQLVYPSSPPVRSTTRSRFLKLPPTEGKEPAGLLLSTRHLNRLVTGTELRYSDFP